MKRTGLDALHDELEEAQKIVMLDESDILPEMLDRYPEAKAAAVAKLLHWAQVGARLTFSDLSKSKPGMKSDFESDLIAGAVEWILTTGITHDGDCDHGRRFEWRHPNGSRVKVVDFVAELEVALVRTYPEKYKLKNIEKNIEKKLRDPSIRRRIWSEAYNMPRCVEALLQAVDA